ncbi:ATP-grasp domain-containing protein [Archaeoglobus sp.]
METKKLIVVGSNVRNVAQSAFKAGFSVYAITDFLDKDLLTFAEAERAGDKKSVKLRVEDLAQSLNAHVVLSSGYEDLKVKAEVLGSGKVRDVLDKLKFYKRLERLGVAFPELLSENDEQPKVVKKRFGGGGLGVRLYGGVVGKDEFLQRFVKGIPFSVTLLVKDCKILFTAVNRVLSGLSWLNARGFKYCGNITPFKHEWTAKAIEVAKELVELFELDGCVGVDFVLADKPYVLEINPRFVGSLDTVELSYGINAFRVLMKGKPIDVKPRCIALRCIYYAPYDLKVGGVPIKSYFADIPQSGYYLKDSPLVSILATGYSQHEAIKKVKIRLKEFKLSILN